MVSTSKDIFLEQTKAAREERALEKRKEHSVIIIQALVRGWLSRIHFRQQIINEFDKIVPEDLNQSTLTGTLEIYQITNRFLLVWNKQKDLDRFMKLCRYLVHSLNSDQPKFTYIGVVLNKDNSVKWINQMKNILYKCCIYLDDLKPEVPTEMKDIVVLLHTLVSFTSINTWKLLKSKNMETLKPGMIKLCENILGHLFQKGYYLSLNSLLIRGLGRTKVALKHVSLSAILTLSLRPLISANYSEKFLSMFLIHILSVPAIVYHLEQIAPECVTQIKNNELFVKSLNLLSTEQNMRIVFNTLEGNYALCLFANLIHLMHIERDCLLNNHNYNQFIFTSGRLLESCRRYVVHKQSSLTHWHPVLGWFQQPLNVHLQDSTPYIKEQLKFLWNPQIVQILIGNALKELVETELSDTIKEENETNESKSSSGSSGSNNGPGSLIRRAILESKLLVNYRDGKKNCSSQKRVQYRLCAPECSKIINVCALYQTALDTLTQLRLNILTGICYQEEILYQMCQFLTFLGPNLGLKQFTDLLITNTKCSAPEFQMLQLFCDLVTHYVTILDDLEMYEQQNPFKLTDFVKMSYFLNQFLCKSIMANLFDLKNIHNNALFTSMHTLLMILYKRDCRRGYTPNGHWLVKDIKVAQLMTDLEKNKKHAQLLLQRMPHVIAHEERVRLFRKYVQNEKAVLGLTDSACASPHSTLITIHRNRIVEDGYRQLALIPPHALKGIIRVRFINEQGLDEAGIDQDGVFKEFLEETIKRVFDPSLNLFKVNNEERLYPSPTSYLQENHLNLFEFIGRMLAKAVYEGIVVDVPFASFFLSQVLGYTQKALYSAMDELPSLDKDLYKSLTFIKHYQGDVSELDLMFTVDEDCMGRITTHELVPGGKAIIVTNDNKINYIHLMAHFHMHTRIKDQTAAFIRGFKSIINPDWLSLFSAPELQRLISGDNVPLDLANLRRFTQYYGGFHDSHRVICWLWDILEKDFNEEERAAFLKFVTSCSKPPLLGFAHLEPPFSIRCVEVGDDEDTGDTIGSVIRGFFTIRKKDPLNRLPTSSTCFNLLKLPNYQKKSTLRDKLRYAILCNTGFELS